MDDQAMAPPAGCPSTIVDEDRIARVARALCIADGHRADEPMIVRAVEEVPTEFGTLTEAPAWTTYTGEARRFIAAARAMGLVE